MNRRRVPGSEQRHVRAPLKINLMNLVDHSGRKVLRVVCSGGWSTRSTFALTPSEARVLHTLLGKILSDPRLYGPDGEL